MGVHDGPEYAAESLASELSLSAPALSPRNEVTDA